MNFTDLIKYLERIERPKKPESKAKKYNKSKATQEDILRLREMINDENYMSNAIGKIADELSEGLL